MRPTAAEVLCGLHNEGVAHITELPLICFSQQPPRPASYETDLGAPVSPQTWCWSGSGNERVRSRRCRLAEGREPPAGWLCPSLQPQYLPDLRAELLARDKDRLACWGAWGGGGRGQTVEALVLLVLLTGRHARSNVVVEAAIDA
ncbi:hypothetical protein E2C01_012018 [Portunus trituberculatus]|uniref:Uncharacterized protein n=1 Tax=Portunus trituberculatus TaxID=210409 RepID=A0A5B7DCQ3_PORTR|nr:hypothetical protein [Portunus trituberculatus]